MACYVCSEDLCYLIMNLAPKTLKISVLIRIKLIFRYSVFCPYFFFFGILLFKESRIDVLPKVFIFSLRFSKLSGLKGVAKLSVVVFVVFSVYVPSSTGEDTQVC